MNSINELVKEIQEFPERQSELRQKLHKEIRQHFQQRLMQTQGQITPGILRDADELYDLPGTAFILAESMHVSIGELRRLLGQKCTIKCKECGTEFDVIEPRRKGGYSSTNVSLCKECSKEKREYWRDQHEQEELEQQREIEFDAQLIALPINESLEFERVRECLLEYVDFWTNPEKRGGWWIYGNFQLAESGPGCLICNQLPVRLFITRNELIEKQNDTNKTLRLLAASWEARQTEYSSRYDDPGVSWAPLIRPLQLFLRMSPSSYFGTVRVIPVFQMPLLILCRDHSDLVTPTHFEPYPELEFTV